MNALDFLRWPWAGWYYLDDKLNIHPCASIEDMARVIDFKNRRLRRTKVGEAEVSTVFLGFDPGFSDVPVLFETMMFGGVLDGHSWRYHTWDEALLGHEEIVKRIFQNHSTGLIDGPDI